jgi:myo-inositol-1(or 4)-monophosphatase
MSGFSKRLHALSPDLAVAVSAARAPTRIIRRGWNQVLAVTEKTPGDLFTEVDLASDKAIHTVLRWLRPEDGICSEELAPNGQARHGRRWVVDPLDASVAFIRHESPQMPATLVALEVEGVVTVAAVHFPITGELFYALRGGGAFHNQQRLSTAWAPTDLRQGAIVLNSYPAAARQNETEVFARLRCRLPDVVREVRQLLPYSGISVRIAHGSESQVVAVVHDNNPTKPTPKQAEWDVRAVRLVLEEAGGVVLDLEGRPYNELKHQPFICAANAKIAEQVIALAKP